MHPVQLIFMYLNLDCIVKFKQSCLKPYLIGAFLYKILLLCLWFTITSHFLLGGVCGACACTCVHVALCSALVLGMPHLTVPISEAANLPGVRSLACNPEVASCQNNPCCLCLPAELEFKTLSCFDFSKNKSFQMYKWKMMALLSVHVKYRWIFSIHLK